MLDPALSQAPSEPQRAGERAARARLRRVTRHDLTILRRRFGTGFTYVGETGFDVTDADRARIEALAIPPAWTEVRIARSERAHLQAIGLDEAGRWQYRYHSDWTAIREKKKLARLASFAAALPAIRAHVQRTLRRKEMGLTFTTAAAIAVIDHCAIRAGHEEYERRSGGRGCATLLKRNLVAADGHLMLVFRGKAGKEITKEISDPLLIDAMSHIYRIPGKRLFQYLSEAGAIQSLTARDINRTLQELARSDISAKDFRTFTASVHALDLFRSGGHDPTQSSERQTKLAVSTVMKAVANHLANTPAVTRSSYVPALLVESFSANSIDRRLFSGRSISGLSTAETALVRFLRRHLPGAKSQAAKKRLAAAEIR